jgi:hypothetical protein
MTCIGPLIIASAGWIAVNAFFSSQTSSIGESHARRHSLRRWLVTLTAVFAFWLMPATAGMSLGSLHADELKARADAREAKLLQGLQPSVKIWIDTEVDKLRRDPSVDPDLVYSDIKERFFSPPSAARVDNVPPNATIDDLLFLYMMEAAREAREDLKIAIAEANAASTNASELTQTRLQMLMDRREKIEAIIGNIMKKISEAEDTMKHSVDPSGPASKPPVAGVPKPPAGFDPTKPDVDIVEKPKFDVLHP